MGRADVATSLGSTYGAGTVEPLAARVFQGSAAVFLGIQTPTVPVGTRSYNMILTGATADVRLPGVAHDTVAGTVRNTDIVAGACYSSDADCPGRYCPDSWL